MLVSCISQVRATVKGTGLASVQIEHVDTIPAWGNSSCSAVVSAVDWLGIDIYPYLETETDLNSVDNDSGVFQDGYGLTSDVGEGKPVWITGLAGRNPPLGQAIPSISSAKKYWNDVGCGLIGTTNIW